MSDAEALKTHQARSTVAVQWERRLAVGIAQVARYTVADAADHLIPEGDVYRLDMAIDPRPTNARAQYSRHWISDRFEKLGSVWMIPPGEPVRFRSEPGTTTCIHCSLKTEAIAKWLGTESGWNEPLLQGTLAFPGHRIRALLRHLGEELQTPGFAGEAMIELICGQVAIEISRYWRSSGLIPTFGARA